MINSSSLDLANPPTLQPSFDGKFRPPFLRKSIGIGCKLNPDRLSIIKGLTERELQTATMTLADQLREEGLQEGLQKGLERGLQYLQEGLQEGIVEVLEIRFGQIADGLRETITSVQDVVRLRSLHKAAIQASSLEDFSQSL